MQGTSITHVATTLSLVQRQPKISFSCTSPLSSKTRNASGRTSSFPLSAIYQEDIKDTYSMFDLKVYRNRTWGGLGDNDCVVTPGDVIIGRYKALVILEEGKRNRKVFKALDLKDNREVCVKMIANGPIVFDVGLNEANILKLVNGLDPDDQKGVVRLLDCFYCNDKLFLVFEMLRMSLPKLLKNSLVVCPDITSDKYFLNLKRIHIIAKQLVKTLSYLHSLNIIQADLKSENILVQDLASCTVKVIDFELACFTGRDSIISIQTRPYEAPEVGLGLEYDQKVDMWSLGCIIVELFTGEVLFDTLSVKELLFKIVNVIGAVTHWMIIEGENSHAYFTPEGEMLDRSLYTNQFYNLDGSQATSTLWGERGPPSDEAFKDFVSQLLTIDPRERPTAQEISQHPWLSKNYEE